MIGNFDALQKAGRDGMDVAVKSAGALAKGVQALASETADYSRRSFEMGARAMEGLAGAGSLDTAVAVQADYVRAAYEGYVGQAARVGEIVSTMTREACRPYEALFVRSGR